MSNNPGEKEKGKTQKSSAQKERELNISSQHDELVITQIWGGNPAGEPLQAPKTAKQPPQAPKTVPRHPHFEGKQPKQHKPPKCISVVCREEKDELDRKPAQIHKEFDEMQRELERTKEELSEYNLIMPAIQWI